MTRQAHAEPGRAHVVLGLNTLAFTVCFAAWMLNGVLVTFLVDSQVFDWTASQMGILIGIPVLTGSITRLPLGMLTDKYGGRPVYALLMLASAVPMYLLGRADSYGDFMLGSLGFGLAADLSPYLWSLVTLAPETGPVFALPWVIKLHIVGAFAILFMVPFSRLVHFVVAPLHYIARPYQQVMWNWDRKTIRDPGTPWSEARPRSN